MTRSANNKRPSGSRKFSDKPKAANRSKGRFSRSISEKTEGKDFRKSGKDAGPRQGKGRSGEGSGPKRSWTDRRLRRNADPTLQTIAEVHATPTIQIPDEERLEGRNAIQEAIQSGRTFNKVWFLKPLEDKKQDSRLTDILKQIGQTDAVMYPVDRKALDRMAVTPSHQGIIAQVAAHEYAEVEDIFALAESKGEAPFILILDQIQDSQNLGAIMRTADAAGVHGIIIPRRRSVALDAAAAKSSAGAIEHVLVSRVTNLNRLIEELKDKGVWIAGLAMDGENIFETDKLTDSIAIVIGNEGKGISQSIEENCDYLLHIPMRGKINSLNASNAAAIAMYQVLKTRL